jgi:hypothetical protein
VSEDELRTILDEYVRRKLMVVEKNLYLSLAIMPDLPEVESEGSK